MAGRDARELETRRLTLRLPRSEDARPILAIHQDPDVVRLLKVPVAPDDIAMGWRNVAMMRGHWEFRGFGQWVVVEKATEDVVGRVGLYQPEGWPGIELGWLIRRDRWGQGLATEAASAALSWAWAHVATDDVISLIQPDNLPSMRVAEKIGERYEATVEILGTTYLRYAIRRP